MQTNEALENAYLSLYGLYIGDAYGNHHAANQNKRRAEVWQYSDDTLMALSIFSNLRQFSAINQDVLAQSFANWWDGNRSYGQGATKLLKRIQAGMHWKTATYEMFENKGSYGNGAAMRVAPLGAYYADDMIRLVEQARLSAEVTHAHPEGVAGAIAIAVAASIVTRSNEVTLVPFWDEIIAHTPESEVRRSLEAAFNLPKATTFKQAAAELGNGRPSIAQRTVPFAIWAAAQALDNYQLAIENTASVGGDVDTNCAIVGGIVVMKTGMQGIPEAWRDRCEPLPRWAFEEST